MIWILPRTKACVSGWTMSTSGYISAQNRISCCIVQQPVFWIPRPAANKFPLEHFSTFQNGNPDRSIKFTRFNGIFLELRDITPVSGCNSSVYALRLCTVPWTY